MPAVPSWRTMRAEKAQGRQRDVLELAVIYFMVLLVFWTPHPWQEILFAVAALSIVIFIFRSFDGVKPMGLSAANLPCSLWAIAVAMALGAVAITLAGVLHTLHVQGPPAQFMRHALGYLIWATIQQLVLQCFFLSRLLRVLGDATWAAAATALLFAVAHLPSPILTLVTLICGMAASLFFLRYRSLFPLVVAHAILGICMAVTIPGQLDHNMYVGLAYLHYAPAVPASISQAQTAKPASAAHSLAQP